jgi:hypothetical protein
MRQKDIDVLPSGHLGQGLEQVMQVGARLEPCRLGGLCRARHNAVSTSVYSMALASAPRGLPANNHAFRPTAKGRIAFSVRLLRIPAKMTAHFGDCDRHAHRQLAGRWFVLGSVTIRQWGGAFAHGFPGEGDTVCAVQKPVEDGIREGGFTDVLVP